MPGVYPSTYVHSLFDGVPSSLSWDLVEAAFRRRVRTGAMLVGVSASTGKVSVAVSADFLNTTAGRAAWRRYKRAQFHLERAASGQQLRSDVLLVMDLKDMVSPREPSDGAVPVFAASRSACALALPVPVPLKGFGSNDLELLLASEPRHRGLAGGVAARPWDERRPQAVWRGSARIYHNESACVGVGQDWRSHPRGELVAISERVRELVDAGFTSVGPRKPNGKPVDPGLARHQRPPLSFAECAGYRYAIEVDGSGYQASLAAKLLSGSTVLAQESRFPLWFSALLRDGRELALLRPDLSNLPDALRALLADAPRSRKMAAAGAARMRALLRPQALGEYVASLLREYSHRFSEGGAARDRWAAVCASARGDASARDAALASVAAAAEAAGARWAAHSGQYCRGADKRGQTTEADGAGCWRRCAAAGAGCFQFDPAARACRCAAAYLGLAPTSKGYVAWVREGAAPQMRHAEPPPKRRPARSAPLPPLHCSDERAASPGAEAPPPLVDELIEASRASQRRQPSLRGG